MHIGVLSTFFFSSTLFILFCELKLLKKHGHAVMYKKHTVPNLSLDL